MRLRSVLLALGSVAAVSPAAAEAQTRTFEGGCELLGPVAFDKPVGPAGTDVRASITLEGRCSGRVDGQPTQPRSTLEVPVATGRLDCAGGTITGEGVLRLFEASFPVRVTLALSTTNALVRIDGLAGGRAAGDGTTITAFDSYSDQNRCAVGQLERQSVRINIGTDEALRAPVPAAARAARPPLGLSAARRQRLSTVLRRGSFSARCAAPAAGRCTVTALADGRVIARGSTRVTARRARTVRVRLTRYGRQALRRSQGNLPATLRATGPGTTRRIAIRFR